MMSWASIVLQGVAIVVATECALAESPPAPPKAAPQCPTSFESWSRWRETIARMILVNEQYGLFESQLEFCANDESQRRFIVDPQLRACIEPLRRFLRATSDQPFSKPRSRLGVVRGLKVQDSTYYNQANMAFPAMIELPLAMRDPENVVDLCCTTKPKVTAKAFRKIQKKIPGSLVLKTLDRFTGEESYTIYVPRGDFDQWLHFESGALLMLSIQKKDSFHRPLKNPLVYYNTFDLSLGPNPKPLVRDARWVGQHEHSNPKLTHKTHRAIHGFRCAECHRTGAIALLPTKGSEESLTRDKDAAQVLREMNEALTKTAHAKSALFDLEAFGPPMGPVLERTDQQIIRCSGDPKFPSESIGKIKSAMNCAKCHDDKMVGRLSYPFGGFEIVPNIMRAHILLDHMPPHTNLSTVEKKVLYACLQKEYYAGFEGIPTPTTADEPGLFLKSLLEPACPKDSIADTSSTPASTGGDAAKAQ